MIKIKNRTYLSNDLIALQFYSQELKNDLEKAFNLLSEKQKEVNEDNLLNKLKYIFLDKENILNEINIKKNFLENCYYYVQRINRQINLLYKYCNSFSNNTLSLFLESFDFLIVECTNNVLQGSNIFDRCKYIDKIKKRYNEIINFTNGIIKNYSEKNNQNKEHNHSKKNKSNFPLEVKQAFFDLGLKNGDNVSLGIIKKKYKEMAKKYHPDKKGGDITKMQKINKAYEIAKKYFKDK